MAVIGDKTARTCAVASDGEFWVSKVLKTITALETDSKHASILVEVDQDDQKLRQKTCLLVPKLRNVSLSVSVNIRVLRKLRPLVINKKTLVELSFS